MVIDKRSKKCYPKTLLRKSEYIEPKLEYGNIVILFTLSL